jgi:hypothetical protein
MKAFRKAWHFPGSNLEGQAQPRISRLRGGVGRTNDDVRKRFAEVSV